MGVGGEAFAAVFAGNDQGEEALLLDKGPGGFGQVHALADVPVADHRTQRFGGPLEERLLLGAQLGLGVGQ
ncbi:hypothetical protein D3C77_604600 [compost metagenome]